MLVVDGPALQRPRRHCLDGTNKAKRPIGHPAFTPPGEPLRRRQIQPRARGKAHDLADLSATGAFNGGTRSTNTERKNEQIARLVCATRTKRLPPTEDSNRHRQHRTTPVHRPIEQCSGPPDHAVCVFTVPPDARCPAPNLQAVAQTDPLPPPKNAPRPGPDATNGLPHRRMRVYRPAGRTLSRAQSPGPRPEGQKKTQRAPVQTHRMVYHTVGACSPSRRTRPGRNIQALTQAPLPTKQRAARRPKRTERLTTPSGFANREEAIYSPHCTVGGINQLPPWNKLRGGMRRFRHAWLCRKADSGKKAD